jgi:glycosyltransferase involved in cell wall biosynthesis
MDPLRILLLSQSYPPRLGGLETVSQALALQLTARGHHVRVVTNRFPRHLPRHETRDGIRVDRLLFLAPGDTLLRHGRLDLWLAKLAHGPLTSARLGRLMRTFRPDIVNLHFPDVMIPFVLRLRRTFRFRLVVSLHGHEVLRRAEARASCAGDVQALKAVLGEADAITACSRNLLDKAVRLVPSVADRCFTIYNGIDPGRFADPAPHNHPRPYVLAYGRHTHKKGFDLLLDAFSTVNRDSPPVDLILAGEGEERPRLEALVRRLSLEGRVVFYGRAAPTEVVRLLKGCLFLTVPSRVEPFGIVALEGLAAGRPVLATRVGGMGEFLERLQASLSPPAPISLVEPSAEALAAGLRTCLQSKRSTADQQDAAATVLQEYSWARIAQRYEEVLTGHNGARPGVRG